jgi:signal transduction histidine kinase
MKSIRRKLWLGMMVLVGIIILLLWLFQIVFLKKFYTVLEVNEVASNANKIIKEIETLKDIQDINSSAQLMKQIDDFVYNKQLTIDIIDTSYNTVYQGYSGNNKMMPGLMKEAAINAAESALNGTDFKQKIIHPKFGYQLVMLGLPINRESRVQGAMLITMPMASVEDTADILEKQLFLITGILLLVSVIISFRLSKRLADPITMISKQAESYTSGQFSMRISDIGNDEIGQLAKRMNEMGEALMRNEVLQREIIANVSHELRTPLTLIRGYAETVRDVTGDNPDKRKKHLDIIVEEAERLSNIVEDILNLSQLQSGALTLEKEAFSLNEMLFKIKEHYELQEGTRTFQVIGASELKENLIGDKKRIEQVFYNLIDNAFRHSNQDGAVEIMITQKPDRVRIAVTDHGEGIAKEDLEHIFERYYRGKRTDGIKSKGTGLGLAIVKSIIELHQMPYGVESKRGMGTTFWFELEKDMINYY